MSKKKNKVSLLDLPQKKTSNKSCDFCNKTNQCKKEVDYWKCLALSVIQTEIYSFNTYNQKSKVSSNGTTNSAVFNKKYKCN